MPVLIGLAALLVLVVLLLAVPLDLALGLEVHGRLDFTARVVWLFGLIRKELGRRARPQAPVEPAEDRERGGRKRWGIGLFRMVGLMPQCARLVKEVLRRLRVRQIAGDMRLGLGDPADTGMLFAFIYPVAYALAPAHSDFVKIRPDFEESVFEGYLRGSVRVQPIRLLGPCLRFAISRPVRELVWSRMRGR